MNKLKAAYAGLLMALGMSTEGIKVNAQDEPIVSAEELESLTAQVGEVKKQAKADADKATADLNAAKAEHEKAIADLKTAHANELANAKAGQDKAIADLTAAHAKELENAKAGQDKAIADLTAAHAKELETANGRIAELETELGAGSGTGSGKPPKGASSGTPEWVDADAPHYAELKRMGIETGF